MKRSVALATLTAPGEPYELEEIELYGHRCRAFRRAPPTLRDMFEATRSDLPFIVYGDERWTFEEAWQEASALGAWLVEQHGVRPGDRVAISMRNYPEWMIGFAAATSVGAIAVAMNALWTEKELAYGLEDSGACVLLADQERVERFAACAASLPKLGILSVRCPDHHGVPATPYAEAIATYRGHAMPSVASDPDDDTAIFYTSGSTGHPKGVVQCHRGIITALMSWELDAEVEALIHGGPSEAPTKQYASLLASPLFHVAGSHAVYLAAFRAQSRVVSMYKWDPEVAAELIERERITWIPAPPAMSGDLVAVAERTHRDLSSLESLGGGGAARAPSQVRRIDRAFERAAPSTAWGMTETNAIGTTIGGQEYLDNPECSGRSSALLDLRVVDERGSPLDPGQRGELQVRGTTVVRGYWNRPDANAEAFVDGWLRTGDVAILDEDGLLYIVDRIKDLVIRGGENIGCGAIEAALLEHPAIVEASVYGVPDERLGEEVGATLFAPDPPSEESLRTFLTARLARFEIPRYFRFAQEPLARTASGKIHKRQLREEASAALAQP